MHGIYFYKLPPVSLKLCHANVSMHCKAPIIVTKNNWSTITGCVSLMIHNNLNDLLACLYTVNMCRRELYVEQVHNC